MSMVMKPKITLKVAKALDNESASLCEASLGRFVWEWNVGGGSGAGCKPCGMWVFRKS